MGLKDISNSVMFDEGITIYLFIYLIIYLINCFVT